MKLVALCCWNTVCFIFLQMHCCKCHTCRPITCICFLFPLCHPAVLQVSGTRAAIQLWPAGHASTEEANVQRTVLLQTHPVTKHTHLSPPSSPAPTSPQHVGVTVI